MTLGLDATHRQAGVQLDAGAEQQDITFEPREPEGLANYLERRWCRHCLRQLVERGLGGPERGRRGLVRSLQMIAEPVQRQREPALICLEPEVARQGAHITSRLGPT